MSPASMVSPPTRGWTRFHRGIRGADRGFPAHAGWTRRGMGWPYVQGGFPAHAGMDPQSLSVGRSRRGFPRPRGDGPCMGPSTSAACRVSPPTRDGPAKAAFVKACPEVSPPTRGWTYQPRQQDLWCMGFPAHAGMDPFCPSAADHGTWFPRPRGDGPEDMVLAWITEAVSPPTRGWTLGTAYCTHSVLGFPAHAGMDPSQAGRAAASQGFPRPRGDGPVFPHGGTEPGRVSPPTRGWTF